LSLCSALNNYIRISLTLYKLEQFLDGDMDEMIGALELDEKTRMLTEQE
jgi:peptide chain release factor 1